MLSNLKLSVGIANNRSYIKDLFVDKPFRVVSVGQYATDESLHLMLMSVSPGILDGDHYILDVRVEDGASVDLETQSFQRIFKMNGKAVQDMDVCLGRSTRFFFIPHPVVPHVSSSFVNKTRVVKGFDSVFVMSEIITCGRKLSGEIFKYELFQNLLEVFDENGRLIFKDNVLLRPQLMQLSGIGMLEGFSHQGALVCLLQNRESAEALAERIHEMLDSREELSTGISLLATPGFILRALGHSGETLFSIFTEVKEMISAFNLN